MYYKEFIEKLKDAIQTEADLRPDTVLSELEEWDSLSVMATMTLLENEFGIKTQITDYKNMKTVSDIAAKAGISE